jgi:anaerobic ribonucleoside-triphosphate reductase activating protein
MSRYNAIIPNDVVNGHGVCVSFFTQGCPHHCPGCFNEETWDFRGGQPYTPEVKWNIIKAISANNITRNFSILGGEPLAPQNINMVWEIVDAVRHAYPDIEITLWTGYTYNELMVQPSENLLNILNNIDILVDGPFIEEEKDLSLQLRGSRNQHIWIKKDNNWEIKE